jgi:hypothetical protein
VRTKKAGAAAKAGHNLLIEVTAWSATLDVGEQTSIELSADPRSLKVVAGSGGMTSLGDEDKAGISQTIDEEVLKGAAIQFRSTEAREDGERLHVAGELELAGRRRPISFDLSAASDGVVTGTAVLKQTDFGMKPYSALFGTLKVVDEVTVEVQSRLPAS